MFVYVIGPEDGAQKIGLARSCEKRVAQLATGNPARLYIHFTLPVAQAEAREIEDRAHSLCAFLRVEGEWFNIDPQSARHVVEEAARQVRAGIPYEEPRPEVPDPHDLESVRMYLGWLWNRRSRSISQEELGVSLGYEPAIAGPMVSRFERGEEPVPGPVVTLCRMFLKGTVPPDGIPGRVRTRPIGLPLA